MQQVKMSKDDFKNEHRHLVKVLLYGTKKAQKKEAISQKKELTKKE